MSDVFISYARSTERAAELIETTLTGLGYTVWRDSSLPIHRPYPQVIEERLTAAKAVVVLWSKDAAGSDWVRAEADVARASKKLVQVSVDNTAPPLPFNQIQCGDLAGWTGDVAAPAWGKLMTSLSALVGTRAAFPSPQGNESFVPLRAVDAVLRPTKPSIAVLPFANLSRNPDQAYFAEGMVVEIVTALSRFAALL
jgi:adenylate cyclase